MCFTQEISGLFALAMWAAAFLWKEGPKAPRACIAYFAAMETLQFAQYFYVSEDGTRTCYEFGNQFTTFLGFVHLAFQPFFSNLYLSYFMTPKQRMFVPFVLLLCLFGGITMLNRLWVDENDVPCTEGVEPLCGPELCSFRGDRHIAWQAPMQHCDQDYFTGGFQTHFFLFFLPPFALGMWKMVLFLLISGPFFGRAMTNFQDEIPAIWYVAIE